MHSFFRLLLIFSIVGFTSSLFASDDFVQGLKDCVKIEDGAERIQCYDVLGNKALEVEITDTKPSSNNQSLPENVGGSKFLGDTVIERVKYRAHVMNCKKASDGQWFYFFENGQVWKQVDRRKRRHSKCDFNVEVSKDGFGWTMQIEETGKTVRISRKK